MSAELAVSASASPLSEWWRWSRLPAFWMRVADTCAVLTALSLPWSGWMYVFGVGVSDGMVVKIRADSPATALVEAR